MSRIASLQKTYDDSYLRCSTAVYYESQGNEEEAMRCWKHALDQIYDHTGKAIFSYVPKSETEKALMDSLRQLELQCKERIDLLEALRISRHVDPTYRSSSSSSGRPTVSSTQLAPTPGHDKGWIGQGTIPAVTYPELSRPALPHRPSLPTRTSSERAVVGSSNSFLNAGTTPSLPVLPNSPLGVERKEKSLRSSSPEKHTMRTTLRSTKSGEKSAKLTRRAASKPDGPGASKAATLAWSALSSKDRVLRGLGSDSQPSSSQLNTYSSSEQLRKPSTPSGMLWDTHTRRLVASRDSDPAASPDEARVVRHSDEYPFPRPSPLSISAASSALNTLSVADLSPVDVTPRNDATSHRRHVPLSVPPSRTSRYDRPSDPEGEDSTERRKSTSDAPFRRKPVRVPPRRLDGYSASGQEQDKPLKSDRQERQQGGEHSSSSVSNEEPKPPARPLDRGRKSKRKENAIIASPQVESSEESNGDIDSPTKSAWQKKKLRILKSLPSGVDETAAKQILNEIVVQGDEVHWSDVAGLEIAKNALREAVIYPFLRPDLFMGLREPARGMLLFGPPGTGKTMLARAVATESRSTFFSISASSLTSKYLGESEKLVRALFSLAKALAPSIIFVDEIDSLLSHRSGSGEHEATRRIKTEFLIQWSDLQRAAAGRETCDKDRDRGDPNRVLVLAATNLPWAIDEAARRRFVRRQYIPLPEPETRATQLRTLLGQQKHSLSDVDINELISLTEGFSGSDITALAKDAAMGPLRSLGDALLHMTMDQIRPIELRDFQASLVTIRPSVSKSGLKEYEDWAKEFGERGG